MLKRIHKKAAIAVGMFWVAMVGLCFYPPLFIFMIIIFVSMLLYGLIAENT